jgi:hypothetical protein
MSKGSDNPLEPTPTISQAAGWRAYGIPYPEPSAIVLGALGAGALLMLRRREVKFQLSGSRVLLLT